MAFKSEKDHNLFRGAPASIKTRLDEIEMTTPLADLPRKSQHPLDVHINRNGFKESLHEVDVAVCDADGSVILGMGDVESVIFPRSAMKPLQSIALIELLKSLENVPEFSEAEVALICASHSGEILHTRLDIGRRLHSIREQGLRPAPNVANPIGDALPCPSPVDKCSLFEPT